MIPSTVSELASSLEDALTSALAVEIRLKPDSTARLEVIEEAFRAHIETNYTSFECETDMERWDQSVVLAQNVRHIRIAESGECMRLLDLGRGLNHDVLL